MSEISDVVRLVAGPFHQSVATIWSGDRIKEYLLAPAARRHIWHAWLASGREGRLADREVVYCRLAFVPGRDLLHEAFGSVPAGLIAALGRLGALAQPRSTYADLAKVLSEGDPGTKFLRHTPSIDANLVSLLAALPKPLRVKPVVTGVRIESAHYLAWLAKAAGVEDRAVSNELLSRTKGRGRRRQVVKILEEHWAAPLFPPPPFQPAPPLVPIASLQDLRAAAKRFDNCLETYVEDVVAGTRYFYLWEGEESAVIAVTRIGSLGWRTDELAGLRNREVSPTTSLAIADALSAVPFLFSEALRPQRDLELDL